MSNPRKRRTIIMGITFTFVIVAQAPNLIFNVILRPDRPSADPAEYRKMHEKRSAAYFQAFHATVAAAKYVPPLWLAVGAKSLVEKSMFPAMFGTLGCFAIGVLGVRRAYRLTVAFYHGEDGSKVRTRTETPRAPVAAISAKSGGRFIELRLPLIPEPATALAVATIRSMLRAPEVKMAWGSSILVTVIISASVLSRSMPAAMPATAKPFIATAALTYSVFLMIQFLSNHFGLDRDGFRALILSPVERRHILLGKNLATMPVGIGFGALLLTIVSIWLHLAPVTAIAALFQLASLLFIANLGGNLLSILVPYRIQAGSLKPTKLPALAMVTLIVSQLCFPLLMAPVFLPPFAGYLLHSAGIPHAAIANALLSAALATLLAIVYALTLAPLGRLLQRRETKILRAVTANEE